MSFDELLSFVRGLLDKWVELTLSLPAAGRSELVEVASFGGKVDGVEPLPASSTTHWRVGLGDPAVLGTPSLMLDRELFPGSLEVVVEVTALAAAGRGTVRRFLYLIERYGNPRLRLRLEEATLRKEIEHAR